MGNKVKGILLFLIFAPLILGAKTTVAYNSGNSLTKEAMQSVNTEINPDSIDLDCRIDVSYNFEGRSPSSILNGQLILTDSVSLYKARTKEHRYNDEYIITTLNKQTANFFKVLLYDLYTTSQSVVKDKYINEPHAIFSDSSVWHIKLSINNKHIDETVDILDYMVSFDDPFNIQFEQIMQLVYAITNKIERDILKVKGERKEAEWITKTFNDEYYEPYNDINSNKY